MNSGYEKYLLDLLELKQLVAVADCGRLLKAAESLNISRPPLHPDHAAFGG